MADRRESLDGDGKMAHRQESLDGDGKNAPSSKNAWKQIYKFTPPSKAGILNSKQAKTRPENLLDIYDPKLDDYEITMFLLGMNEAQYFSTIVSHPTDREKAFFADRKARGLGVGTDESGRIVYAKK